MSNTADAFIEHVATFKDSVSLGTQTLARLFSFPWRRKEIMRAIVKIWIGSLRSITISSAFTGLVVAREVAWHMNHVARHVDDPRFTSL